MADPDGIRASHEQGTIPKSYRAKSKKVRIGLATRTSFLRNGMENFLARIPTHSMWHRVIGKLAPWNALDIPIFTLFQ